MVKLFVFSITQTFIYLLKSFQQVFFNEIKPRSTCALMPRFFRLCCEKKLMQFWDVSLLSTKFLDISLAIKMLITTDFLLLISYLYKVRYENHRILYSWFWYLWIVYQFWDLSSSWDRWKIFKGWLLFFKEPRILLDLLKLRFYRTFSQENRNREKRKSCSPSNPSRHFSFKLYRCDI